uniref:Uncharacterized protein n=1 Tax=Rhizophora mucronata TaxID=61149 RepID=A0A2P2JGH9_RHIMU
MINYNLQNVSRLIMSYCSSLQSECSSLQSDFSYG